jgi:hypothetical protein
MIASLFAKRLKHQPSHLETAITAGGAQNRSRVAPVDSPAEPPSTRPLARRMTKKQMTTKMDAAAARQASTTASRAVEARAQAESVNSLVGSMRTNMAAMRQKLADVEEIGNTLKASQVELEMALGDSQGTADALKNFNEEMEGDFKMMQKKPVWAAAVDSFLEAALGENPDVSANTPALVEYLAACLGLAEPEVQPLTASVVAWHPMDHSMLKVFHAVGTSDLKAGANLRENTTNETAKLVWDVMRTGEPHLSNPHGLERTSEGMRSVVPLKSTSGKAFGALVNGPPAMPDELLELISRMAGPLLERVWKTEKILEAVGNVVEFIRSACLDSHQLVYVKWKKGETPDFVEDKDERVWLWQPLAHRPRSAKQFELGLKWKLGEPIGTLVVSCGTFTEMNEQMIVLLHTSANILQQSIEVIEDLVPGDAPPLATVQQVMAEYESARDQVAQVLSSEVRRQLQKFDAVRIFAELKSFEPKAVDADQFRLVQGCLCVLGWNRKSVAKWADAQRIFKDGKALHSKMLELDLGPETKANGMKKSWDESAIATKGLDYDDIASRSTATICIMMRWLLAVRMTHKIALAIEIASQPPPADPIGDKVFDLIDADHNGVIEPKELITYMLREFPSKAAHALLRVLDTDQDAVISRDEWRKGWSDGLLTTVLMKEREKEKIAEGTRLKNKRGSVPLAMTAALAAQNYYASGGGEGSSSDEKKKSKKNVAGTKNSGFKKKE